MSTKNSQNRPSVVSCGSPGEPFAFTKHRLEGLATPSTGRAVYRDANCPGLTMRITSNGARSFYFYRKVRGRPVRLLLGKFPEMTVEQARTACRAMGGDVAKGKHPADERRAGRREQTIGGLFAYWLEGAKARETKTWGEDEKRYERYLKPWEHRKLSTIRKSDVQSLFARVATDNGRYAANRMLALLKAMFHKAPDMGFTGADPTAGVKKFTEEKRDRFIHAEEMRSFFASLLAEPNETLRDLLLVCLLTGARKGNVMAMAWADIDFATNLWRIPETKSGKPVVVPLVGPVVQILETRRKAANGTPWVFPGRGKTGHITEIKSAWKRVIEGAKLNDCRPHDLRRSLASYMAIAGTGLPVIGAMLGHSQPATTAIYARLSTDPVRTAAENAATSMLTAGKAIIDAHGVKLLDVQPRRPQ